MHYIVFPANKLTEVLDALKLEPGEDDYLGYTGVRLNNGQFVIYMHTGQSRFMCGYGLSALKGVCDAYWCCANDSVMYSNAGFCRDGVEVWSVIHDLDNEEKPIVGNIPPEAQPVVDRIISKWEAEGGEEADYDAHWDIPPRIVEIFTGFYGPDGHRMEVESMQFVNRKAPKSALPIPADTVKVPAPTQTTPAPAGLIVKPKAAGKQPFWRSLIVRHYRFQFWLLLYLSLGALVHGLWFMVPIVFRNPGLTAVSRCVAGAVVLAILILLVKRWRHRR